MSVKQALHDAHIGCIWHAQRGHERRRVCTENTHADQATALIAYLIGPMTRRLAENCEATHPAGWHLQEARYLLTGEHVAGEGEGDGAY